MRLISQDTPLAEITLRKYERPHNNTPRDLVRKLCLSSGLLQPGDSRDVIVDILHVLLSVKSDKKELTSEEIRDLAVEFRKQNNISIVGTASSNVRRQIKRLRDMFLVEKVRNKYRITEFNKLNEIFEEKIEQYMLQSLLGRVKEYCKVIDEEFS
ncbi:hypothetical protein ACFL0W_04555 [Nanoarchaeota archaeon]